VIDAVARGDEAAVRALLHPYLHWTDATGATVRGRRNVLALLAGRSALGVPVACELRDGQVYRWREGV
jgi:limonene-1,2-epoxide hydrolase